MGAMNTKQNLSDHPTVEAARLASADEGKAVEFFEARRWGSEPACPRCGAVDVYQMVGKTGGRNEDFRWRCRGCKTMFSVRTGTVLEESRLPLRIWAHAFWRACSSKKGVSALQIKRETGISYKSALFLLHRIRFAMSSDHDAAPKLTGTVEVDETYVGGKPRFRRHGQGSGPAPGFADRKAQVVALVQRDGNVRALVRDRVTAGTFKDEIRKRVEPSATIYTDEAARYVGLGKDFAAHESINHKRGEYARGPVTTNTVEGFFSLLKRGLYGTFHSVSKHHLHRYVSEFEFRYNSRDVTDGERLDLAIRAADGKRLSYYPMQGAAGA